jgi:hypothetical protein
MPNDAVETPGGRRSSVNLAHDDQALVVVAWS